jgi:PelA/Pel-15E family pectate lyase
MKAGKQKNSGMFHPLRISLLIGLLALLAAPSKTRSADDDRPLSWRDCLRQPDAWYDTDEALRVADNVLLYQRASGGWPKNTDMARRLTNDQRNELREQRTRRDSTIDNGATCSQMEYLARVHTVSREERHRDGFLGGLDFLLEAQYENGGWPQYFPDPTGYHRHITFNDHAMVNVLRLLKAVGDGDAPYAFVPENRRQEAAAAVDRGIECILESQVPVDGTRTAWCAQHDAQTLEPAPARAYEKISLSGSESVGIVRFLMDIENPSPQVIEAVESAVAWFRDAQLEGIRQIEVRDPALPRGYDKRIVQDEAADPLWARFHEIGTNRPIFSGRDGVVKYSLAEIEHERRVGYSWYTSSPRALLERHYPAWKQRLSRNP